jgi:ribA/ribD-fused uncharacterized protein
MVVWQFRDRYAWLSNFAPVEIEVDGIVYPSVEHAYQACKCDDVGWKNFCSDKRNSAASVKKNGRKVSLIPNWDSKRLDIMKSLINKKFDQEPYRSLLIETGNTILIEGNNWGDTFYGVSLKSRKGHNHLGRLIMSKREELK